MRPLKPHIQAQLEAERLRCRRKEISFVELIHRKWLLTTPLVNYAGVMA